MKLYILTILTLTALSTSSWASPTEDNEDVEFNYVHKERTLVDSTKGVAYPAGEALPAIIPKDFALMAQIELRAPDHPIVAQELSSDIQERSSASSED